MNHDRQRLVSRLKRVKDFLEQNVKHQPTYPDLIATLESIGDRLNSKLTIKIVSPSATLAANIQAQHESNEELRSLYKFETVSPIRQLQQILENCDLICLIYQKRHEIRQHHYKLIELAQKRGVDLLILVQREGDLAEYSDWQKNLNALADCLLALPFDPIIDFDSPEDLAVFQRSLIDLATVVNQNRLQRIEGDLVREIKRFFHHQTTSCWQAIKQTNARYCAEKPLYLYQQQFNQNKQALNQFRQQLIRDIKQDLNHEKTDLLNPFIVGGLIFDLQQLINSTEAKIAIETEQTYLYLALTEFPQQPFIHDYVLELCQQRINEIISDRWSKINSEYASGGLQQLLEKSNRELNEIQPLLGEPKVIVSTARQPSLDIEQIVDRDCLKIASRIPFDYSFTQSSWFRLFISALVGTAIYVSTWLFLGTGKYIGFMIIIFQIINLITGQNIKKAKLKQQTKELKRIVDRKYQSLARTMVSYLSQTLIVALDRECQLDREEYSEAIAIAQSKLDELKQSNEQHKSNVDKLKRDRGEIMTLFD